MVLTKSLMFHCGIIPYISLFRDNLISDQLLKIFNETLISFKMGAKGRQISCIIFTILIPTLPYFLLQRF